MHSPASQSNGSTVFSVRYDIKKCIFINYHVMQTNLSSEVLARHRRLVAGIFPRSPFFDTGPLHMIFVLDKMAGGLEFSPSKPVSSVSITSPMLHTHTDYYEKYKRAKSGNLQSKKCSFKCRQTLYRNLLWHYSLVLKMSPGHYIWYLCWIKWQVCYSSLRVSRFPLSVSLHRCSTLILTTMRSISWRSPVTFTARSALSNVDKHCTETCFEIII